MTISVNTDSNKFLLKVLKPDVQVLYHQILDNGVVFQTSLYSVTANKPPQDKNWQVNLPIGVFSLMKEMNTPQAVMAVNMINEFVCKLHSVTVSQVHSPKPKDDEPKIPPVAKVENYGVYLFGQGKNKIETIKLVRILSGMSLKEAKDLVESTSLLLPPLVKFGLTPAEAEMMVGKFSQIGTPAWSGDLSEEGGVDKAYAIFSKQNLTNPAVSPYPLKQKIKSDEIMQLVSANAVGQKVHGSSKGSVYITIAVNPRVKVAARVVGTQISLRVEANSPTKAEQDGINSVVQWKSNYGSTHFDSGPVPIKRVLGALIYGMGVKFDETLKTGEIVGGN